MTGSFLERIILRFPEKDDPFERLFSQWFMGLGKEKLKSPRSLTLAGDEGSDQNSLLEFNPSEVDFYPKIGLSFLAGEPDRVRVDFVLASGEIFSIRLENITGEIRQSPHIYSFVKIEDVIQRLKKPGDQTGRHRPRRLQLALVCCRPSPPGQLPQEQAY